MQIEKVAMENRSFQSAESKKQKMIKIGNFTFSDKEAQKISRDHFHHSRFFDDVLKADLLVFVNRTKRDDY